MVAYRWGKVNTHFSAKVCTLRICALLQPVCDTFCMQKHSKRSPLECYLVVCLSANFTKCSCCFLLKLGWYSNKPAQSGTKICLFLQKTVRFFHRKSCIFAHFLPIRGCFFDVFSLRDGKQNVSCSLAI